MGFFQSSRELEQCIGALCEVARRDSRIGPKISATRIIVQFRYADPAAVLTINAAQPATEEGCYFDATWGEAAAPAPEVTLTMAADVAHRFWHGKVNLLAALGKGQIVQRGPIAKILRLLPAIEPLYTIYPQTLRSLGRDDLVVS